MLTSSVLVLFQAHRSIRTTAAAFLVATTLVSHGVDKYFWSRVWDLGHPCPYLVKEFRGHGFIGTVTPYMNQVATVVFAISGTLGLILLCWHLARRSSKPPPSAAEL